MTALPSIPISYSSRKSVKFNRRRTEMGDGYTERFTRGINNKRMQYSVTWNVQSSTDKDTLETFFNTTEGTGVIDWQPPGEPASLKWSIDGYETEPTQFNSYTITATFIQEFD